MVVSDPKARVSDLGILAFETAATMSRLVSLHHMVSDQSISNLRSATMRSQGVAYLISTDQAFLFRLVCAELINELDRIAEAVSRLNHRCRGAIPVSFDRVYADLKAGLIDPSRLGLSRGIDKRTKRMEKFIAKTSKLYSEMEVLADLEAKETRKWGKFSSPIPIQNKPLDLNSFP